MPLLFDFHCRKCGRVFESIVDNIGEIVRCQSCDAISDRVFSWRGCVAGKSKGLFPYFDTQLGTTLESAQHRDRIAKERGLYIMGNDEFRRSRNAPRSQVSTAERDLQRAAADEKLWNDLKYGNAPLTTTAHGDDPGADVLDIRDAPKITEGKET